MVDGIWLLGGHCWNDTGERLRGAARWPNRKLFRAPLSVMACAGSEGSQEHHSESDAKSELNAISRRGAVRAARATVLCHAASYRGVPFCAGAM